MLSRFRNLWKSKEPAPAPTIEEIFEIQLNTVKKHLKDALDKNKWHTIQHFRNTGVCVDSQIDRENNIIVLTKNVTNAMKKINSLTSLYEFFIFLHHISHYATKIYSEGPYGGKRYYTRDYFMSTEFGLKKLDDVIIKCIDHILWMKDTNKLPFSESGSLILLEPKLKSLKSEIKALENSPNLKHTEPYTDGGYVGRSRQKLRRTIINTNRNPKNSRTKRRRNRRRRNSRTTSKRAY